MEVINRYASARCFLHLISLFRLFREFSQKLSEASKNRGDGNWLQESPSRSINLQRFWPICFVTIPFSKLSFYLSLRYVESSSRIKKTFPENPFLLSFSGIIFSDLYLSNFVSTRIKYRDNICVVLKNNRRFIKRNFDDLRTVWYDTSEDKDTYFHLLVIIDLWDYESPCTGWWAMVSKSRDRAWIEGGKLKIQSDTELAKLEAELYVIDPVGTKLAH